jgi:hypothetical protein
MRGHRARTRRDGTNRALSGRERVRWFPCLRDLCDGCITLLQPYAGEPRFIVVVDEW